MRKWLIAIILLVTSVTLMWTSKWQQEIVIIDTLAGRTFNFMGFGNFNLDWWSWRDVFYAWDILSLILASISSYMIGKRRGKHAKKTEQ